MNSSRQTLNSSWENTG
ncbi:hypothetical protein YPPY10_1899, partial [Yersinia pestis PY-10]